MTEIAPDAERVTAVLTSHMGSGEDFEGAIVIGIYPNSMTEIWIESHGQRTNIQCSDVDVFCKQLKRAKKIAQEQKDE